MTAFFFCSVLSLQGHFQSTQSWKLKTVSLSNQDNKDNAFLLGKDWIGLLEAPYKIKGFPSSGFLGCDTDLLCAQHPPGLLLVTPRKRREENTDATEAHSACCAANSSLWSLTQWPVSSASI